MVKVNAYALWMVILLNMWLFESLLLRVDEAIQSIFAIGLAALALVDVLKAVNIRM